MYTYVNSAINHKGYTRMTEFGTTQDISRGLFCSPLVSCTKLKIGHDGKSYIF